MLTKLLVKRLRAGDELPNANLSYPPDYEETAGRVTAETGLRYPSRWHNNTYDLYYPTDSAPAGPAILWIHGGSFVAGSRSGIVNLATLLAAAGCTVIAADYALAPEARHPIPVEQMQELYVHLCAAAHPQLDLQNLFLAGDSAGALIAAQLAAAETNPQLAAAMGLQAVLLPGALRGAILTCGPYDLPGIRNTDSRLLRMGLWVLGRALFEGRPWHTSEGCRNSRIAEHVTAAYPPTYITDGNHGSFEVQGRRLAEALRRCGVPVTQRFFEASQGEIPHEYHFRLAEEPAQLCLKEIIQFIETYRRQPL